MDEKAGIDPIKNLIGKTRSGIANPLEQKDQNKQENQAVLREKRTENRDQAGPDRVNFTRQARQQNITPTGEASPEARQQNIAPTGEAERQGIIRVENHPKKTIGTWG